MLQNLLQNISFLGFEDNSNINQRQNEYGHPPREMDIYI